MENKLYRLLDELTEYGKKNGLVEAGDEIYTRNRLLEYFGEQTYVPAEETKDFEARPLAEILEDLLAEAESRGCIKEGTVTERDLFDTGLMGCLTPPPSVIRKRFSKALERSPQAATEDYYAFSKATNYIRTDRIRRDEKWQAETEFGRLDITINLSKPEKDPRDIARAGQAKKSGYPACLLCLENEGYAGHLSHPARQNHRVIPLTLAGEPYFLQYSPYVYYNEHCIIFNRLHTPMRIDRGTFDKLLDFVRQFPHYTAGSNADLPIVGGSILSHDHFQGGNYEFPMVRAPYEKQFTVPGFADVTAGLIHWPLTTIRLRGETADRVAALSERILSAWRGYTDEEAFIFAETEGVPHNTITPIARMRDGLFEMDLVLRNNLTTEAHPLGEYHPHPEYHHIKKENIGLIEVMGLAVLPARLKKEMSALEQAILNGEDPAASEITAPHAAWAAGWKNAHGELTAETIHGVVQQEIGAVFAKVLACCGVFRCTKQGRRFFDRFLETLKDTESERL